MPAARIESWARSWRTRGAMTSGESIRCTASPLNQVKWLRLGRQARSVTRARIVTWRACRSRRSRGRCPSRRVIGAGWSCDRHQHLAPRGHDGARGRCVPRVRSARLFPRRVLPRSPESSRRGLRRGARRGRVLAALGRSQASRSSSSRPPAVLCSSSSALRSPRGPARRHSSMERVMRSCASGSSCCDATRSARSHAA